MPKLPSDQRAIDKLPPGIYSSEKITGLVLQIKDGGSRKWRVKFQVGRGGARKQKTWTIGDAKKIAVGAAEAEARKRLAQVEITKKDPRKDTTGETFDALVRDWIEKHGKAHKRSWPRDLRLYEHRIAPLLGPQIATAIERQDVIVALDDIAKKVGKIQANRCQSLISACYSWALDEGRVLAHPAIRIRKRGKERADHRFFLEGELRAIWAALDDMPRRAAPKGRRAATVIADAIKVLALLGQRNGEVAGLARSELNLVNATWSLPPERAKNKRLHLVPLPPMAKGIIERAAASHDMPFIFTTRTSSSTPLSQSTLSARFHDLLAELKIDGAKLHTLRHTAKTYMAEMGVPDEIADRVQNHVAGSRDRGAAAGYDHSTRLDEKRRALSLWQHCLMAMVEGRPSSKLRWIENEPGHGVIALAVEPDPGLDAEYGPVLR